MDFLVPQIGYVDAGAQVSVLTLCDWHKDTGRKFTRCYCDWDFFCTTSGLYRIANMAPDLQLLLQVNRLCTHLLQRWNDDYALRVNGPPLNVVNRESPPWFMTVWLRWFFLFYSKKTNLQLILSSSRVRCFNESAMKITHDPAALMLHPSWYLHTISNIVDRTGHTNVHSEHSLYATLVKKRKWNE